MASNDPRRLQWTEPAAYKRERHRKAAAGRPPDYVPWLIALGLTALMIGASVYRREPYVAGSWPLTVLLAIAIPFGLMLFLRWTTSAFGDTVILSEKGINRNGFEGAAAVVRFWPWDRIARCTIHTVEAEGKPLRLLFAHTGADRSGHGFAIAPAMDPEAVVRTVEANGKACEVES
jgi:hypothetical protein